MEGRHYDCHAEHFKGETFYGYSNELELLTAIQGWWCRIFVNYDCPILHAINFEVTGDETDEPTHGALVLWST